MVKNTMWTGKWKIELTSTPFSITSKSSPAAVAEMAVERPEGPAPMMSRSRTGIFR